MNSITAEDIKLAVQISNLSGYTGKFVELGGGEVNDTFRLDCGTKHIVIRFAKYKDIWTLRHEAHALKLMHFPGVPKLIFFDEHAHINKKLWIIETYVSGKTVNRLNENQFRSLGKLLAQVHNIPSPNEGSVDLWEHFLYASRHFGDEGKLLDHPDPVLRDLIRHAQVYFGQHQSFFKNTAKSLVHGDATPSNILVNGDEVALIDWEFSKFEDPMIDFSTIYYDDMEYNRGRWRPHINPSEKSALLAGYKEGGGVVDMERVKVWMNLDKLGAAVYLYWKLHESKHDIKEAQLAQYHLDLHNLTESIQKNLP